jgi:hypothetical protein
MTSFGACNFDEILARNLLIGIVNSCVKEGRPVADRLRQFRAIQETALIELENLHLGTSLARQIIAEADRLLSDL